MAGVPGVGVVAVEDDNPVGAGGRSVAGEVFRWPYQSYQSKKLQEQSEHFKRNLKVVLKQIREKQKRLVVHPRMDAKGANALEKLQNDVIQSLRTMLTETDRLITEYILLPEDVQNLLSLQRDINIEMQQLELYIRELAYYRAGCPTDGFGWYVGETEGVCVCVCMCVFLYVFMYACISVCVYVHMLVCVCA
jgi:Dictyostelium STAT, coiled coil